MRLTAPVRKLSAWTFVTFGSGGLSVGFVAGSGGQMILKSPSGVDETFTYGGVGAGLSAGLKIPKIGKIQVPTPKGSVAGGPMSFPSTGAVFVNTDIAGGDLTKSDIQGLCMFAEVGGGVVVGGSGTGMFIGLDPILLPALGVPGFGPQIFLNSAKGMILMAGVNAGIQAQIGGSIFLGYLG